MPEIISPARALVHRVASITRMPHFDPPVMESVENRWTTESGTGPGVARHESLDRASTPACTTSFVSRPNVVESIDHYPSPSLPVQPPVLSSDLPINPDIYVPTHGRLVGQATSRIEETATDRNEDGAELTGHLPRHSAQDFADAVDVVCLHAPSLQRHAI